MEQIVSDEENEELTPVQKFYKGRSVFITGGTGLVGRVLVEKLLRSCPGIGTLYLLIRPKKGISPEERRNDLLNNELFSLLKKQMPSFKEHIVAVHGDIVLPKLGISDEDMEKMKTKVSVVIHSAARVRYKELVSVATKHNLIATKYVIEICKELPKIAVVVYVSTSYVYRDDDCIAPEVVTRGKISAEQLIDAVGWMDEFSLTKGTKPLVDEKIDIYCLTKALAENVVVDSCGNIPAAIVRPGLIANTWKEPIPGWCDTIQGLSGLVLAASRGFLRTLFILKHLKCDVIPADIVANTIIATAWYRSTKIVNDTIVVNCVADYEKLPIGDGLFAKQILSKREKFPLTQMYRYPDVTVYYSWTLYKIHALIDQYIPAFFFDIFIYAFTGKTLMVPLYRKIESIYGTFLKFALKPWIFKRENFKRVMNNLTKEDSEIFFMDTDEINWSEYIDDCLKAGRRYIAHEDPSTIPYARRKAKVWWFVTTVLKWTIILYLVYFLISKYELLDVLYEYLDIV